MVPILCVVDTNVVATAEGLHDNASATCQRMSAEALQTMMAHGHLFLDAAGEIVDEYLDAVGKGQPGAGGAFVRWVLRHEWAAARVSRVAITPRTGGPTGFVELPRPMSGVRYDPSDEKFLAVSAAHPDRPSVLQACDSKWWGWQKSLAACGVKIHFLCPDEIRTKHAKKMGKRRKKKGA